MTRVEISSATRALLELLTRGELGRSMLLVLSGMFVAALETISIGIFVPVFLKMVSGDTFTLQSGALAAALSWLDSLYTTLGIPGAIALILTVYIVKNALIGLLYYYQVKVSYGVFARITGSLLRHYLGQPYEFFLRVDPAVLIRNVYSEVPRFIGGVYLPAVLLLSELLVGFFLLALLLRIEPAGGLVFFATLIVAAAGYTLLTHRSMKAYSVMRQEADFDRLRYLTEAFNGIKEVKTYGIADFFLDRHARCARQYSAAVSYQSGLQQIPRLALEIFAIVAILLFLLMLHAQGNTRQEQMLKLALYIAAALRLLPAAIRMLTYSHTIRFELASAAELRSAFALARGDPGIADRGGAHDQRVGQPFSGFALSRVGYRYAPDRAPAIRNVSIEVRAGELIGVVGDSGSGKTTLLNMLAGLLEPTEGEIRAGGSRSTRPRVSYVPQTTFIINDLILANITLGVAAPDHDRIWKILEVVQLADFVRNLPGQLEYGLGSAGMNLSGGQKQRIGIARALYAPSDVLVLDEATSALDSDTERGFLEAYIASPFYRTTIMVTHRHEVLRYCSRVLRLGEELTVPRSVMA